MSKVRGVRFSTDEEKLIEEFLKKNSFFDFSTLAKIAILNFIESPSIQLKAVNAKSKSDKENYGPN
jgi:hypothetical protein